MKRIFSVIALAFVLICGGAELATVQAKGKKGHHSSVVKNNEAGYKTPVGHTYQLEDSDKNVSLDFIDNEKVVINYNVGDKMNSLELTWTQTEDDIEIPGLEKIKISKSGRNLTETTGKTFKLVK